MEYYWDEYVPHLLEFVHIRDSVLAALLAQCLPLEEGKKMFLNGIVFFCFCLASSFFYFGAGTKPILYLKALCRSRKRPVKEL